MWIDDYKSRHQSGLPVITRVNDDWHSTQGGRPKRTKTAKYRPYSESPIAAHVIRYEDLRAYTKFAGETPPLVVASDIFHCLGQDRKGGWG